MMTCSNWVGYGDILDHGAFQTLIIYCALLSNVCSTGYAIEGDFQMLLKSFPVMKDALKNMKRIVDLQVLHRNVSNFYLRFLHYSVAELIFYEVKAL